VDGSLNLRRLPSLIPEELERRKLYFVMAKKSKKGAKKEKTEEVSSLIPLGPAKNRRKSQFCRPPKGCCKRGTRFVALWVTLRPTSLPSATLPIITQAPVKLHPAVMVKPDKDLWVTLDLHLMNWGFMDQKIRVRTSTRLFSIRNILTERHGRIKDLTLYLTAYLEEKEMKDEMMTLQEYFDKNTPLIEAQDKNDPDDKEEKVVAIYYDFKPISSGPILLDWQC
jgi:hypothetical protein